MSDLKDKIKLISRKASSFSLKWTFENSQNKVILAWIIKVFNLILISLPKCENSSNILNIIEVLKNQFISG